MKKYIALLMLSFGSIIVANAMSYEMARDQALYLTDKMAYELNLNDEQYDYCYEINLDYLMNISTADDVYGPWLTYRNADIRNILYDWQYSLFIAADYFFHPVYWRHGAWYYPIYSRYAATHFFFSHPRVYFDYRGGHSRLHFRNSFYVHRPHWNGGFRGMDRAAIQHRPVGNGHMNANGHMGGASVGTRSRFGAGNNGGLADRNRGSVGGVRNQGGYDHPSSTRSTVSGIGGRTSDVRDSRSVTRGSSSVFSGGTSRSYHIGEGTSATRSTATPSSATRSSALDRSATAGRSAVGTGSASRSSSFGAGSVGRSSVTPSTATRSSELGRSAASSRSAIGGGSVSRSSSFGGGAVGRSSVAPSTATRSSGFGSSSVSSRSAAGSGSVSRSSSFGGGSSSRGGSSRGGR